MRPIQLNGKTVHQIAMPFHFGQRGPVQGGATNDLVADFGRAERHDHGSEGARLQHRARPVAARTGLRKWMEKYVSQSGPPNLHPEQPPPGRRKAANTQRGHGQHGKPSAMSCAENFQSRVGRASRPPVLAVPKQSLSWPRRAEKFAIARCHRRRARRPPYPKF